MFACSEAGRTTTSFVSDHIDTWELYLQNIGLLFGSHIQLDHLTLNTIQTCRNARPTTLCIWTENSRVRPRWTRACVVWLNHGFSDSQGQSALSLFLVAVVISTSWRYCCNSLQLKLNSTWNSTSNEISHAHRPSLQRAPVKCPSNQESKESYNTNYMYANTSIYRRPTAVAHVQARIRSLPLSENIKPCMLHLVLLHFSWRRWLFLDSKKCHTQNHIPFILGVKTLPVFHPHWLRPLPGTQICGSNSHEQVQLYTRASALASSFPAVLARDMQAIQTCAINMLHQHVTFAGGLVGMPVLGNAS